MPITLAGLKCCCNCTISKPAVFADWASPTGSFPFQVSPPAFWTDEGGGAIKTTTTGKIAFPLNIGTLSDKYRISFTMELTGVAQMGTGPWVRFSSSGATLASNNFGTITCGIGSSPWDVEACHDAVTAFGGTAGLRSWRVNGSEIFGGLLETNNRTFQLVSGSSLKLSNFQILQKGIDNGVSCPTNCIPESWYPRFPADEITVTIASASATGISTCADCSKRVGTFVLPKYSVSAGQVEYRLAGDFGCGRTYLAVQFLGGTGGFEAGQYVARVIFGGPPLGTDSGIWGYGWDVDQTPNPQPCGTTLTLNVGHRIYSPTFSFGGFVDCASMGTITITY